VDLSIAVISYNTRDLLLACLQSVQDRTTDVDYEVIVVDNASCDGSVDAVRARFPHVTVIASAENNGFAKACNQAAAVSSGRYLLLLNSDTVMQRHTLRTMVTCLDQHLDIGAVSCLQRDECGRLLRSCFPFPSLRDHVRYAETLPAIVKRLVGTMPPTDFTQSQDVDWANGACLMVRKALFARLGGLDERFFMYFEMSTCVVVSSNWAIAFGMSRRVRWYIWSDGAAAQTVMASINNGNSAAFATWRSTLPNPDGF
jgi:GT2 family glycosyltransferase